MKYLCSLTITNNMITNTTCEQVESYNYVNYMLVTSKRTIFISPVEWENKFIIEDLFGNDIILITDNYPTNNELDLLYKVYSIK